VRKNPPRLTKKEAGKGIGGGPKSCGKLGEVERGDFFLFHRERKGKVIS